MRCPLVSSGSERKDIERLNARICACGHAGGDEHGLIAERCDLALIVSHDSALVGVGLAAAVDGDDQIILGQAESEVSAVAEIGTCRTRQCQEGKSAGADNFVSV